MSKTIKNISLTVFGGVAWMVCAVVLPMNQGQANDGLMARAANLLVGQAYAEDDKSKSDDESSKSDDEGKSKDSEGKDKSSSAYDFSSATLICVSKTTVENTLSGHSESAKSDDESKSKDEEGKSGDDSSKSDDGSSKSDDSASSSNDGKVTLCHVPPGNEANPQTLSVAAAAVDAHLNGHAGDYLGACFGDDGSKDSEAKSDDESKSKDSEAKSDDGSKDSESKSSDSTTSVLAECTTTDGSGAGVWIPESAKGDSAKLTAYIGEVQAGLNPAPDSSMDSYREIRGQ